MFKVIEDIREAHTLWEAGLLWYRAPAHGIPEWRHPIPWWRCPYIPDNHERTETLLEYAILLEG